MMIKTVYPKTKNELIDAIKNSKIEKIEVMDGSDSRINEALRKSKSMNVKRTIIIVEERI